MHTICILIFPDHSLLPFEYNCKIAQEPYCQNWLKEDRDVAMYYINLLPPEGDFSSDTEEKQKKKPKKQLCVKNPS